LPALSVTFLLKTIKTGSHISKLQQRKRMNFLSRSVQYIHQLTSKHKMLNEINHHPQDDHLLGTAKI